MNRLRLVKAGLAFGTVAGLVIAGLGLTGQALAATGNSGTNLTTAPIYTDLVVKPGNTTSTTLQVQNNAAKPVTVNIKLKEFDALGDSGNAHIYTPPVGDLAVQWVSFSKNNFLAQPGVWNNITMTISVPTYAAFGYYYAVLFTPAITVNANTPNTNKVQSSNAILVLVNANTPGEKQQLSVSSFKSTKGLYEYLPATFNINIKNDGNVFVVPSGDIYISRTKTGPVIDTLNVNPNGGNILPASARNFTIQWENGFPVYQVKRVNGQTVTSKSGQPEMQLSWNISKLGSFRIGRYYARYVVIYSNGTRDIPVSGEITFWVMPWTILILGLFSLLSLPFIVITYVQFKKRKDSRTNLIRFIVIGLINLAMAICAIYSVIYLSANLK
jgi:hypothetical protein